MHHINRTGRIWACVVLLFAQSLASTVVFAQSAEPTAVRDFYSTPGLNPFEERINDSFNESISPFNGILQLTYVDVFLPGNGGMDIEVIRRYQSSVQDINVKQVYGYGWDISFGSMRFPSGTGLNENTCLPTSTGIDTRDNPVFTTADGSSEMMVFNDGSMAAATNAIMVSKGRYMLACEPIEFESPINVWVVYRPDGMRYELGFQTATADASGSFTKYVTKISDPNGNEIQIDYAQNPQFVTYITRVYDPNDSSRFVDFTYLDENSVEIRLDQIETDTQTWQYEYTGIFEYNDAAGALGGFANYPDFGNYHLTQVVRPDNREWRYEYFVEELVPGTLNVYQKWHHLIKEVNYPFGARIEYTYQDVYFGDETGLYNRLDQVIATKTVHTEAQDRITDADLQIGLDELVWTYAFFPGNGTLGAGQPAIGDLTVVQTPIRIERYLHYGYFHTQVGDIWKIGLLIGKSFHNEADHTLYQEQSTWAPQVVSSERYWNGRAPFFLDGATNAPLLVNREIFQHGLLYTTDFSNHDAFGSPVDVERGGSSVPDTIDTTNSYFIDTDLWIVNRPQNQTTVDVGTVTRQFDPENGNLLQINNYGVTTDYTYTSQGDLATEIDANNELTTYLDYYRGVPRRIEYPENKVILRTVNTTGTIASETNGRTFTTNYDYDVMNRLTLVDYPIHADVTIEYSLLGRLKRTLTRENYREVTRFNSFMNPVEIAKTDLATGTTITTVNEFDILGRQTFASKPTYGSYPENLIQQDRDQFGVTTIFDGIGRELEVRNPDNSQRFFKYFNKDAPQPQPDPGSVGITDERNNVTINRFAGYGSPDDNRLVAIEAPENMTTLAGYDKLGNITSITQGEQDGPGHVRRYNFDSRFFLVSEDHPEIGHVVFGRDAVGNMTSRQVKNSEIAGSTLPDSEITIYAYDGLNRLTSIDYPGTTPDVSYTYDGEDNVKSVDNSNSSRGYDYDENNNLTGESITIGTETYNLGYGYNNLDYLDTITYPSSRAVIYTNDGFGRPTRIINYVDAVTYFPGGQRESMTYANGVTTTFTLNEREWVASIETLDTYGDRVVDLGYVYDGKGNVEQINDGLDINSRVMTYDGVDRLKTADGMWGSGSFAYDHEDNMTSRNIGGTVDEYVVANNQMLQLRRNGLGYITPAYDVYGNQLNTFDRDLTFDDASNLRAARIPPAGSLTGDVFFRYDGNNRRVVKQVGQITPSIRHYVYSRGDVVFSEIDFDTNETRENIFLGSQKIASVKFDSNDPVAQISLPANVLEKVVVTLDGTGSFDPDGTITTYEWSQVSGTPVALIDLGSGLAEFESPIVVFDENLVFQLIVTDNDGNRNGAVAGIEIRQTDTDGDGISDLWEAIYFPGNLAQMGGNTDFDNDGLSDLEEFRGGTEPIAFDRLDKPSGILVTTGIDSVELAWPAVPRATRYAVYTGTTPNVPLNDANRSYTSSSPFLQDDLTSGQFLYYVVVAERLDAGGNFLGDSPPSDTASVKVGWDMWPQRIVHSTSVVSGARVIVDEQGNASASWGGGDTVFRSEYTQQTGWSPAVLGDPVEVESPLPSTARLIFVISVPEGLIARYFDPATGTSTDELILSDPDKEYFPRLQEYEGNDYGFVVLRRFNRTTSETSYYSMRYSASTGWTAPELIPLATSGGFVSTTLLIVDAADAAQFVFEDNGVNVIAYTAASGWSNQSSLGLDGGVVTYFDIDGTTHVIGRESSSIGGLFTLSTVTYSPALGWSGVSTIDSAPAEYTQNTTDLQVLADGRRYLFYELAGEFGFKVSEFLPGTGWSLLGERLLPTSCRYDDYPANINEIFDDRPIPVVQEWPADTRLYRDVVTNDQGVISIISWAGLGSARINFIISSRFEPGNGWLPERFLHCPWAFWYGGAARNPVQAINSAGTTFVFWPYTDAGEFVTDIELLSNKFELLKGAPPVANAGADQAVTEGDEVFLDASQSTDPDNEIVAYAWNQLSGTPVNMTDRDTALASFIAPLVVADETLTFELTVTDNLGNQAQDTVDVVVSDFSSTELGVVLSSTSAGPLTVGDTLALSAQAAGGSGGAFEYQFRYKALDVNGASWVVLQAFGAADSVVWDTAGLGGKYRLQVRAREVGNEAVVVKDSISIWVNSVLPLTGVTLSSDAIGPQLEGFVATLTAVSASDAVPGEYRFEIKNTALQADWILLQDYAPTAELSWNSSGFRGKNRLRVSARKAGTSDFAVKDTITIWINAPDAVTSVLLTPSLFSPQPSGTLVDFDAAVIGGNGNVEYRFSIKDTEGLAEWVTAQNWSSLSTFAWDTAGIFGKQRVRVEARNAGNGDRAVKDRLSYWLNDSNPLSEVTLQVDQPKLIVAGPPITLTAIPTGSTNLYEYQFRVKGAEPEANWGILRDFDSNPVHQVGSVSFLGKNRFQVRARNQGTLDKEVKDATTIWVNDQDAITDVALSGTNTTAIWGETVTFTMTFTGGDGTYYYKKELKNPGEGFVADNFFRQSSGGSFDFRVSGMQPGVYRMRVQVINAHTDKPVKSNSVRFEVVASSDPAWQVGGENYDQVQTCTVYICPCVVFESCDVGVSDPGVEFGAGY